MKKTSSRTEKVTAVTTPKHVAAPTRRFSISRLALAGRPMVTISAKPA